MKKNYSTLLKVLFALLALLPAAQSASAQGQEDLQQLLDKSAASLTRSESDITEIDISNFTEPYTKTLYVRNNSVRFVNGTLTQADTFDGPLIQIQNGYTLEVASTATLAGNNQKSDNPLVEVESGCLTVYGMIKDIYKYGYAGSVYSHVRSVMNKAVKLSGSHSILVVPSNPSGTEGIISGEIYNYYGIVNLLGGTVDRISTYDGMDMSGNVKVKYDVHFYNEGTINLLSAMKNQLIISNCFLGQAVVTGSQYTGKQYTITNADVEKLTLYNNVNNYQLSLENNAIYVREAASTIDPNNITNEDDLQKILDEIAEKNPVNPVSVKICEEGIVLSKRIKVQRNCKAIITGGTISVWPIGDNYTSFEIYPDAYLSFNSICLDFQNVHNLSSFFTVYGKLEITDDVVYKNISADIIKVHSDSYGYGFYINNNNGHIILHGGYIPAINGNVAFNVGKMEIRGDLFTHGANIYNYRNVNQPHIVIMGTIHLLSNISEASPWTINGNWDDYPMETPFIESSDDYTLQASDYWQMRFTGLPSGECEGRTQYFDGSAHTIKLKEFNDLQCLLDGGSKEVDVPCEGVDAGKDVYVDLQTLLDGGGCESSETDPPVIWMPGGCVFFPQSTIVTDPTIVKNATFDSFSSGHRVYIRRHVTFDHNVRARNFLVFTIVEKGGYLIWRNAWTENVLYPIYNDGGTVDIVGGNLTGTSYNLNGGALKFWGNTKVDIIDNNSRLTIGGAVSVNVIKHGPLGKIFLTSKLSNRWTVDLTGYSARDFYNGQVIMEGGLDYVPTAADLAMIDFKLPVGCSISYDAVRCVFVLHVATFPIGDVNLDLAVDVADISSVISVMADSASGSYSNIADVNGDGAVDVADISSIISIMSSQAPGDDSKYDNSIRPEAPFVHNDGEMPCVSVGQITANIEANLEALPGGATIIGVTTKEPIERFFIAVSGQQGYYIKYPELPELIGGEYVYRIPVLFPQDWDYDVIVKVGGQTKDGRPFACKDLSIQYHRAGTGALQVSLTFDNEKDIDLHLYTPSGTHYYYGSKGYNVTLSNGESVYAGLDVDSNAGCHIDGINCENITLPEEILEEGIYKVFVNMYNNCDASIATGWTCVATRGGKLISNQLSSLGNPASGVYPVGQQNNDMTEVMRIKVELAPQSRILNHRRYVMTPVPLDDSAVMKMEEEKARKIHK